MGCRCPHYHFATIDGSKCPSSAREVKTSLVPLFSLFLNHKTQLHSVLPGRISKDITDINKVRLWAPPGESIISTFSRTNHLTNLTCPGQTRESCSRAEGTTQTPGHLAHALTLVVGGTWDGDRGGSPDSKQQHRRQISLGAIQGLPLTPGVQQAGLLPFHNY